MWNDAEHAVALDALVYTQHGYKLKRWKSSAGRSPYHLLLRRIRKLPAEGKGAAARLGLSRHSMEPLDPPKADKCGLYRGLGVAACPMVWKAGGAPTDPLGLFN